MSVGEWPSERLGPRRNVFHREPSERAEKFSRRRPSAAQPVA